ncbi:aminotransferase-like domain-containing protein [Clostridium sp. DL1XJH146]
MEIKYSKVAEGIKDSEIRELLKLTARPEIISFAGGLPAGELFPVEEMKEVFCNVMDKYGRNALQYSSTEGNTKLREFIAKDRMKKMGVETSSDNVIITSGSQQGLLITAQLLLNEGDTIICEKPTYLGALNAFDILNPNYIEIDMDEQGIIPEKLEEALKNNPEVKFVYTIPEFQNPTGKSLSVERRKKIAQLAAKYKTIVVEDNPYGELRFEGEVLPSIKSFDEEGYVIYLGTFSKTFCPGLRIGWVCGNEEILDKYVMIKQSADLHTNTLAQFEIAEFVEVNNLDDHINKIIKVYRKRRDTMIEAIDEFLPEGIKFVKPEGGLFIWVELDENLDSKEVFKEAIKENVAFVPGHSFYAKDVQKNMMRLNYSSMEEEAIVEGIKRLGTVIKKMQK